MIEKGKKKVSIEKGYKSKISKIKSPNRKGIKKIQINKGNLIPKKLEKANWLKK